MSDLDFSKLNREQQQVFRDAYQYIRQRAAWLKAQKKTTMENLASNANPPINRKKQGQPCSRSKID